MQLDTQGKVGEKRLGYNNTLLPLFEAIVNSIQAIEEDSATKPGIIKVDIIRTNEQEINYGDTKKPQITEFHITDNGIGFNEANFDSFNFANSMYKKKKGGKGLGRFMWLRAFQIAEIESVYRENANLVKRNFNFEPTRNGIENHIKTDLLSSEKRYTTVKLKGLKKEYWQWCNSVAEDIAFKIIEHCFIYFLSPDCPRILLYDEKEQIVVNDHFHQFTSSKSSKKNVTINKYDFEINIVRLYHAKRVDNKIHFVADTREVESKEISKLIPELENYLYDVVGNKFSIGVYVTSKYFDERVNDERTKIDFVDNKISGSPLLYEVEEEALFENILNIIRAQFTDNISSIEKQRKERITKFIEEHPQYNKVIKYKGIKVKNLSSRLSDKDLEIEFFKIKQELDLEVRIEAETVFAQIEQIATETEIADFKSKHKDIYAKIIDIGNSKLSEYVLYRKFILEFLEKHLRQNEDAKFAKEEIIHKLIFPLRTESDNVGHEEHNLWLIDERLAFHNYLASDKSLKKNKRTASNSHDRPDIIIFNTPFAFTNSEKPYTSVVIIEFKRPMRDDYTVEENPITQVVKYARELLENKVIDKDGRLFDLKPNTPIYAYIVCDITPNLRTLADDNDFTSLPDNDGYFDFNKRYGLYTEIVSFDKMIKDSKQRNKVFFEKLNLQTI